MIADSEKRRAEGIVERKRIEDKKVGGIRS